MNRLLTLQTHLEKNPTSLDNLQEFRKKTLNKQTLNSLYYGKHWERREGYFSTILNNPTIFQHHSTYTSLEELRYFSFKQLKKYFTTIDFTFEDFIEDPRLLSKAGECLFQFEQALGAKYAVSCNLFGQAIVNLGTDKHFELAKQAFYLKSIGSFSLTELGHGTNAKDVQTQAIYLPETNEFVINTPNDLAIKFWIGATAELAHFTVVFAQLYIKDVCYGPHFFVVPLRNRLTHNILPGITIGDCGLKQGVNGIDNGFLKFDNVKIPKDSMLDKFSQIDNEGNYKTSIPNEEKRFGIMLGSLVAGRLGLVLNTCNNLLNCLVATSRYCAVRRQFSQESDKSETSLLNYQLIQYRLIPLISGCLIHKIAGENLVNLIIDNREELLDPKSKLINEMHALLSVYKAVNTWYSQNGINQCRQICGGLGYSTYSRIGSIMADNDINQTWEGDNSVLIQQTSKFVMDSFRKSMQGEEKKNELLKNNKSLYWLENIDKEEGSFVMKNEDLEDIAMLKKFLEYGCRKLVRDCAEKLQNNLNLLSQEEHQNKNIVFVWNEAQVFYLHDLAKQFGRLHIVNSVIEKVEKIAENDPENKKLMFMYLKLWILNEIDNNIGFYFDIIENKDVLKKIKENILGLCAQLKDYVIPTLDAIAPPSKIIGSFLANENGEMYKSLMNELYNNDFCFKKVSWWKEIYSD